MENIRITLETLYDVLRNEKKREDLQKLEDTFFIDVVNYLQEKNKLLESKNDENELFAAGEKKKVEYELNSIKRILKEIYERREKKIIDITLNKSRTGSDIIDTSSMLKEEKQFYKHLLEDLDIYRKGILLNLFRGELPFIEKKVEIDYTNKEVTLVVENEENSEEIHPEESDEEMPPLENNEELPPVVEDDTNSEMIKIKFLHPTPSFVWKDMKVYGPFEKDDETSIFPEVAKLLVRKGRAERV
tara:strand:+ start:481 stop:1215 length:735 start_codon:yes stop_codon:yes gene_type:complete